MRVRSTRPDPLAAELSEAVLDTPGHPWSRVAVDGHPLTGTGELADSLAEQLRLRGRHVLRVRLWDYVRPASLRLERGREDPDSFRFDWFDFEGLVREVLAPLAPGGPGLVLPALWDPELDRSPRLERVRLTEGGVAVLDGPFLLGGGLELDFTVHLWMSEKVLARRVAAEHEWQLPAFAEYQRENRPDLLADRLVRMDRPERPVVVDSLE
ncbi:uridine kinase [Actinopolyspora erythraea]|uniref:Uridine kinase n=1 Tax=Actinopolyspora erythraea TaxID=414996 RepID=A0A099D3J1_9ACTN|nr:uridine kinase [Actinopolyspora erythraea]ASU79268.1 uridine kinase [Actinopolyspora erythraea]KGI80753.1 uridine kinase [Actinopolyspora erythraea]